MIRFDKEQVVIDVAGVKVGGQPGEYPTVLAGTIFYGGHNIISDEKAGVFDKDAAEERIKTMEEMQDITGNPCIVQTFGATPEAIEKYLEFIGDISDKPFLIDSTSGEARSAGAQYVQEAGLVDRAIYNSINMSLEQEELDILKETDINATYNLTVDTINDAYTIVCKANEQKGTVKDANGKTMKGPKWVNPASRIKELLIDSGILK